MREGPFLEVHLRANPAASGSQSQAMARVAGKGGAQEARVEMGPHGAL